MAGPLTGIRVLDLSERSPSAAVAGMLMSDLGAEVIRVEPETGDPIRGLKASRVWLRGQKSVTVGPKQIEDGSWAALRASADVLLHSAQPWNDKPPRLLDGWDESGGQILSIITAKPQSTADARRSAESGSETPVYGELMEGEYGFNYYQDGVREKPLFLGFPHATYGAAWTATNATLAALYERERTGQGQEVTTSLVDGMGILATHRWNGGPALSGPAGSGQAGTRIGRMGLGTGKMIVSLFECSDGLWVQAHTGARGSFERLMIAMDRPDFIMEEGTMEMTPELADQVWTHLANHFKTQPAQHWFDVLAEADVPCMPALPPGDSLWLEQTVVNEQVDIAPDGTRMLGKLAKYSRTPQEIRREVPSVGQHNSELLSTRQQPRRAPAGKNGAAPKERVGPLDGLLVLDFGFYMAGPFSPRNLADLGARVIKFEEMIGDPMRRGTVVGGFLGVQRGKEGLAINLKSDEGRKVAYELVKKADVVHHNQRAGAAKRLGIDYETLREINPKIVYCHSSGYGNEGPWANLPTFEPLHSAATGMLHRSGGKGNPPVHYVTHMDYGCGLTSTAAVLAALIERERSGQGQYLEVPQIGAGLFAQSDVFGKERGKVSETFPLDQQQTGHAPTNAMYRTSDDWLTVACYSEREWRGLERALGLSGLPSFPQARDEQMDASATADKLRAAFAALTTAKAKQRLAAEGVASVQPRLYVGSDAVADPLLLEQGLIVEEQHPTAGQIFEIGHSARFSHQTKRHYQQAPELGQHTRAILKELGRTDGQIDDLIAQGAFLATEVPAAAR